MARKTKEVTISKGRDNGKVFVVTEMPLLQADRWANRVFLALAKAGVDVSSFDYPSVGVMGMAQAALNALGGIDTDEAQSLADDLLSCVQIKASGGAIRDVLWSDEIEDLTTLMILRKEALMIHLDFLTSDDTQD